MIIWPELPEGFEWVSRTGRLGELLVVAIWRKNTTERYSETKITEEEAYKTNNLDGLIQDTIDKCYQFFLADLAFRQREAEAKRQRRIKIQAAEDRIAQLLGSNKDE